MSNKRIKRVILSFTLFVLLFSGSLTAFALDSSNFALSQEEQEYIQEKKVLKVAMVDEWQPISQRNDQGGYHGLAADILRKLEAQTGLKVEYVAADSYLHAIELTEDGLTDIAAVVAHYAKLEDPISIMTSEPYLETDIMMFHSKRGDLGELATLELAQIKGHPRISNNPAISYMEFDTPNKCLLAVRTGQADATYCNAFTGIAYIQDYENQDLEAISLTVKVQLQFGVSAKEGAVLKGLLDRTIASMSRTEVNDSLTHNRISTSDTLGRFVYLYLFEIICVVFAVTFLIILLAILYVRTRGQHLISLQGYEKSYQMMADTVGGIGLNYNCTKNNLTVFGSHADQLSIPAVIPDFRAYLDTPEKGISLTTEQLEQLLTEGMAGKGYEAELECRMSDGEWQHFRFIFSILSTDEAYRRPLSMIGYLTNVEEAYREKENLLQMSLFDKLTGLYSREGAEAEITKYMQMNSLQNDILMIIDVDHFKAFNDSYGHDCGDAVLVSVGRHLKQIFRRGDILCRWGGDEFFLYLVNAAGNTQPIADRLLQLQKAMAESQYEGKAIPVTLSIGGTIVAEHSLEEAFKQADRALYMVKNSGRNDTRILSE